ncbi:glycoside hydrolase family 78 protein [Aureobasidium pullulans]|uniref:Glycoside hydrolase family 78 protein n=1 Tax=Aureobasidium pullulans TaxID=5580 RepID=A0A4S8ZT12_AURPU|nr:glycoside hydrolase family 78 protein [Aureobasidium pullulans]
MRTLEVLRTSIDKQLYSDLSGAYFVSDAQAQGIAQDANAMAILANVPQASHLLNNLWLPTILKTNANYTGWFWETLDLDGRPGLGDGTSLCHAWSSGPTAELSRNVLGIQPVAPGFHEWRVAPQSLGLTWAKGSQPTPFGDIAVEWRIDEAGLVTMIVESPVGTQGTVSIPSVIAATNASRAVVTIVNGRLIQGSTSKVRGGEAFVLSQYLG